MATKQRPVGAEGLDLSVCRTIFDDKEYYTLTLLVTGEGRITWSTQTGWTGPSPTRPGWEMRAPSLVHPRKMLDLWKSINRPGIVVNDELELYLFLRLGGNCIIESRFAEKMFSDFFTEAEFAPATPHGWIPTTNLSNQQRRKAPTRKLRMKVLLRDGGKCRICGRRPETNVDVELDVHHIRPWGRPHGGLTEEENLLTLCETCHDGLDPHCNPGLYEYVPNASLGDFLDRERRDYDEGVDRYRARVASLLQDG